MLTGGIGSGFQVRRLLEVDCKRYNHLHFGDSQCMSYAKVTKDVPLKLLRYLNDESSSDEQAFVTG